MTIIRVAIICTLIFIFNEVVFTFTDLGVTMTAGDSTGLVGLIINVWRLFPFILLGTVLFWALYKAFEHEPYEVTYG